MNDLEILLVEDNEGDVEMTRYALQETALPCRLTVVNDGMEALAYLRRHGTNHNVPTPHLILLDLNMPRMSGKKLLEVIKRDEHLKIIPVVILTSSNAPSDIVESYMHFASCYVVKPFDSTAFIDTVRQTVSFWTAIAELPSKLDTDVRNSA